MDLKNIRRKIDLIDSQILKLINDRTEYALISKKFKKEVKDEEREKQILERISKKSSSLINKESIAKIYDLILKDSKFFQEEDYKLIGFQGAHGAYSEVAAKSWDEKLVPIPCVTFAEIFQGVEDGSFDLGIIPVENTLGGVLGDVNQLLINTSLKVVGAVDLDIHHCLLALPEADHREIREVYSHSQALSQCKHFLERSKLHGVAYYDTAGSAKFISEEQKKFAAAIASRFCAELYDLEVLKENIEDISSNKTRFLIIAKEEAKEEGTKCSIIFSTIHKAGTLFHVLELFAKNNINLSRIESVPGKPGDYVFFLDFEGAASDEKVVKVMKELKPMTTDLKLMGCYKEKKASS
ncbi:MAG: bifunctional chorismate mutase/prephenate dehydratase [Candidatus Margulisbacteria bacterium]|nr:bifunctional chorismate mutase/prephenate dehydratase [Candidatus Margulisiibacteriota bacterium]